MSSIFQKTPFNYYANSPVEGEITLMAAKPNYDVSLLDNDLCKQIKECGFNAVGAVIAQNAIEPSLTNCYNNGLKLFVYNGTLLNSTESFVKEFKNHKGLGGWLLNFKLGAKKLVNTSDNAEVKTLIAANNAIIENDLDPSDSQKILHPIFIGLIGDWQRDLDASPIDFYSSYIQKFEDDFKPSLWPILYVPDLIPTKGDNIPEEYENRQLMFYKNLQYFAYVSRYTCVPFWSLCRCQSLKGYYNLDGKAPTLNQLRGIVFSALAYGAQGIYYWNYRESTSSTTGGVTYSDAPIDINGTKTATYDIVKKVNAEVKAYNLIFHNCEMVDCRHLRTTPTKDLKLMTHAMGPLEKITDFSQNLLISIINKEGKNYLVIISDPFVDKPQTITLHFNEYWTIRRFQITSNTAISRLLANYQPRMTVEPGQYLIYSWE